MKVHILPTLLFALSILSLMADPHAGLAQKRSTQNSQHLYRVFNRDNDPGFIDRTGRLVIGFDKFQAKVEIGDFHEGLAVICFLAQQPHTCKAIGYIDQNAEIAIAPRFKQARDFSEGLAYVGTDDMNGFIDRNGKVIIKLEENQQLLSAGFQDGRAIIRTSQGLGFIDRTGKVVIEPRYSHVLPFSDGLAAVASGYLWKDLKYGFIDRNGQMVIPPRFEARVEGGPYAGGYIDTSRFSEGLARVMVGGLYGYINKKGKFVIPPKVDLAGDFSEGLAYVVKNDKVGFIDKQGRWVIPPRFAQGKKSIYKLFGDGLAPVALIIGDKTRWGYVDRTGKMVIQPTFADASPFNDGIAMVTVVDSQTNSLVIRYIGKTGRFLWEPK